MRLDLAEKDALKPPEKASIFHKTVLTVAQTEQFAAAEEEENLVVPDEVPQNAAHHHLFFGSQLLAGDDHALGLLHLVLLKGELDNLVAQVDKGDACGVVAAAHNHVDSVSQFPLGVEEMYGKCVVSHSRFDLDDGAKIVIISKLATFWHYREHFFTPYINMSRRFHIFAPAIRTKMVELLVVWAVAVVAFFALWAILLKVIKRISDKRNNKISSKHTEI